MVIHDEKSNKTRKASLTMQGETIVKARKDDYNLLFDRAGRNLGAPLSPREKDGQPMSRFCATNTVNKVLKELGERHALDFTSHYFRKGFLLNLWGNTLDLRFCQQTIGHSKIETTLRA